MSFTNWTSDQMLSLAPDTVLARAAERMANPQGWLVLGHSDSVLWGEYPNPNRPPFHVMATLPDLALTCDCAARKRPCRHALGLILLAAHQPIAFTRQPPPNWVSLNLKSLAAQQQPIFSYETAVTTYQDQLRLVRDGMARFCRWLQDTVHGGLATLPSQPVSEWNEIASRLSEAGATGVANDLREIRRIAGSRPGWPQEMLRRLGRLYLLTQGFAVYETLPVESQSDLRGASGWFDDPDNPGDELLTDRWLVLGAVHSHYSGRNMRRTWLYGLEHRRFAFISRQSHKKISEPALFYGTGLEATLRFAPGGWPQRAALENLRATSLENASIHSKTSLEEARSAIGKALSVNPWLRRFPLALSSISVARDGDLWTLRDRQGYVLPLPKNFMYGWHLQVLTRAPGSILFGEWDGLRFTPLAIYHDGSWLALRVLRGQK